MRVRVSMRVRVRVRIKAAISACFCASPETNRSFICAVACCVRRA
jgi:hypothetical protein